MNHQTSQSTYQLLSTYKEKSAIQRRFLINSAIFKFFTSKKQPRIQIKITKKKRKMNLIKINLCCELLRVFDFGIANKKNSYFAWNKNSFFKIKQMFKKSCKNGTQKRERNILLKWSVSFAFKKFNRSCIIPAVFYYENCIQVGLGALNDYGKILIKLQLILSGISRVVASNLHSQKRYHLKNL